MTGTDPARPVVALIGALDTKGAEYAYLCSRFADHGADTLLVDTGVLGHASIPADVDRETVARRGGAELAELVRTAQRNDAMLIMASGAAAVVSDLVADDRIHAVMAIGGSNAGYVMAECSAQVPIGFPKILVSTIASGDTRPYVRDTDLTLINSVVDINGLNRVTRPILNNAVDACVAMARSRAAHRDKSRARFPAAAADADLVAISMFGVTTPAAMAVQHGLQARAIESVSFHCTGVGGRTLETLVRSGFIQAVADLTTTELADDLVGGDCSAGPTRLTAAADCGVPQVVSVGALDMVNFWGRPVPTEFSDRTLLPHNPTVTLMRTNPAECAELGRRLAVKINRSTAPVAVLFPHRGLSALSVPGGEFADAEADAALFTALRTHLRADIDLHEFDTDINDPVIAATAVELLTRWLHKETR